MNNYVKASLNFPPKSQAWTRSCSWSLKKLQRSFYLVNKYFYLCFVFVTLTHPSVIWHIPTAPINSFRVLADNDLVPVSAVMSWEGGFINLHGFSRLLLWCSSYAQSSACCSKNPPVAVYDCDSCIISLMNNASDLPIQFLHFLACLLTVWYTLLLRMSNNFHSPWRMLPSVWGLNSCKIYVIMLKSYTHVL
jgi:hypothetical protein